MKHWIGHFVHSEGGQKGLSEGKEALNSRLKLEKPIGDTGFEPVTSSVSRKRSTPEPIACVNAPILHRSSLPCQDQKAKICRFSALIGP